MGKAPTAVESLHAEYQGLEEEFIFLTHPIKIILTRSEVFKHN